MRGVEREHVAGFIAQDVASHGDAAPGEFAELNLELPAASTVSVHFRADAPLDWNVHSHPDGEVKIHDSGSAADAEVPFTSTGADVYSYLWENHGDAAVTLHVWKTGEHYDPSKLTKQVR